MTELAALVTELRLELRNEFPLILHTAHVPRLRNRDGGTDRDNADEGGVGMPFTVAMHRRLSHPDWWGIDELAALSILEVGDWCRSRHLSDLHRSPGRSTSLCQRIVSGLAEFGAPIGQIAWRESIDEELTYALAVQGLRHAFAWRHRRLHQYMRTARERERDALVVCPLCSGRPVTMRRGRAA
jgi:hypothetical protein